MEFLAWLEATRLARWVSESDSLWAYPTVLVLHTIGLALLVGANVAINLRLLGVAASVPLPELKILFRPVWIGFAISALSGTLLFIADAVHKSGQLVFLLKLGFISVALAVFLLIRSCVGAGGAENFSLSPSWTKVLALLSLTLWIGAITTARLMAYVG